MWKCSLRLMRNWLLSATWSANMMLNSRSHDSSGFSVQLETKFSVRQLEFLRRLVSDLFAHTKSIGKAWNLILYVLLLLRKKDITLWAIRNMWGHWLSPLKPCAIFTCGNASLRRYRLTFLLVLFGYHMGNIDAMPCLAAVSTIRIMTTEWR